MSIEQVNSSDFNYDTMLATLEVSYIGKSDITISEYDSDAAPVVKVGSKFEVNGALFKVLGGDETPSGYTGISNSTTFYLMYDVSGEEFVFTSVSPVWNDALQGWYETGETDRYFFSMFKDSGGTLYEEKRLMINQSLNRIDGSLTYDSKQLTSANYLHGSSLTSNTIFDKLDSFIPDVGNIMKVTGGIFTSPSQFIISKAERTTTGIIVFSVMNADDGAIGDFSIPDGGAGSYNISIGW